MLKSNILKLALFATGLSGIVAEYILGTLASYLLGDSVIQWTMIISVMMFSMGLGSRFTRHIEGNLDREAEDFELKVMSAGADRPFSMLRQYKKHIGKRVNVTKSDEKNIRGVLLDADNKMIRLQEEITVTRGKSKKTVKGDELTIPMSEVKQTKVVITF